MGLGGGEGLVVFPVLGWTARMVNAVDSNAGLRVFVV